MFPAKCYIWFSVCGTLFSQTPYWTPQLEKLAYVPVDRGDNHYGNVRCRRGRACNGQSWERARTSWTWRHHQLFVDAGHLLDICPGEQLNGASTHLLQGPESVREPSEVRLWCCRQRRTLAGGHQWLRWFRRWRVQLCGRWTQSCFGASYTRLYAASYSSYSRQSQMSFIYLSAVIHMDFKLGFNLHFRGGEARSQNMSNRGSDILKILQWGTPLPL